MLTARATAFLKWKQYPEALVDLDQALSIEPDLVAARLHRANANAASGDFAAAVADYDRVIDLNDRIGAAWFYRGQCRLRLAQRDAAIEDLREAVRLLPPDDRLAARAKQLLDDTLAGR